MDSKVNKQKTAYIITPFIINMLIKSAIFGITHGKNDTIATLMYKDTYGAT